MKLLKAEPATAAYRHILTSNFSCSAALGTNPALEAAEGWRAHLPDFRGCRAEGASVEGAIDAATSAAAEQARSLWQQGVSLPTAQSYEDLRHHSNVWVAERGIDGPRR